MRRGRRRMGEKEEESEDCCARVTFHPIRDAVAAREQFHGVDTIQDGGAMHREQHQDNRQELAGNYLSGTYPVEQTIVARLGALHGPGDRLATRNAEGVIVVSWI